MWPELLFRSSVSRYLGLIDIARVTANKRRLTEGLRSTSSSPEETSSFVVDVHTSGLAVTIEPAGSKSWMVYYRFGGKVRWYRIGGATSIELKDAQAG
jgi:hypothetical protein